MVQYWRKINWALGLLFTLGSVFIVPFTTFIQIFGTLVFFFSGLFVIPPINDRIRNRAGREWENYLNSIVPVIAVALVFSIGILSNIAESNELYYSDFTEEELRSNSTNLSEIGYTTIIRDYSSYQNNIIRFEGEVSNVQSFNNGYLMMVETSYNPRTRYSPGGYQGNKVWVEHEFGEGNLSIEGDRPVEGMVIEVLGEYLGPKEYETTIGSVNTVPRMSLWYAETN